MKTFFRVLTLAAVLTAFSALTFAQDRTAELTTLLNQFKKEGPPTKTKCGGRGAALVTGKKIVETFEPKAGETDQAKTDFYNLNKEVIEFVKTRMKEIQETDPVCDREQAYIAAFKDAQQTKNWANVFTTGDAIINAEGDSGKGLDVKLDLVSVGFDRAALDKNDAYNAKTLALAKSALDAINAGKRSNSSQYGAFVPFKTKEDAQSWLNYIIGWEMYNKMNQKKEALPYFYKAAQVGTAKKNDTSVYTNIGRYYFDEAVRLDTDYREKLKANNNVDTDETRAILALARGTADRAADAFGRAYKIATVPELKKNLNQTLIDLYKFRFNQKDAKPAEVETYISGLTTKQMPDPATAVTPVVVEATPTTTTSNTSSNTTLNTTNAATTSSTNTTSTTTKAPTTKTPATKTPAKKPAPKKKGTR